MVFYRIECYEEGEKENEQYSNIDRMTVNVLLRDSNTFIIFNTIYNNDLIVIRMNALSIRL